MMKPNVLNTNLSGKVAVVTGAGGVLCSDMAKTLARAGAKVALLNRTLSKVQVHADAIVAEGGKLDLSQKEQRQALIDTFINAVYLYDDKVLITFNYKEGTETVSFDEATEAAVKGKGSDMDCLGAPEKARSAV